MREPALLKEPAFAETSDFYRVAASSRLDPQRRSSLGQYMTPVPIARFMASLFSDLQGDILLLDPGAGVGSLSAAVVERACFASPKPRSIDLTCYEIEPLMHDYLNSTLSESKDLCLQSDVDFSSKIKTDDFILAHIDGCQSNLFVQREGQSASYTHVIMNPPYKKINANSAHRAALRNAGIETSNLYTGFMYLAALRLEEGGEFVAIVPRSFCNGPYFKPFRDWFLSLMGLRHIHIFDKRNAAFKGDEVLQENIIIHAVKGVKPSRVTITTSRGGGFGLDRESKKYTADDMTQRTVDYSAVVRPDDPNRFVHIATNEMEQGIVDRMGHFTDTLADLGLEVSTGPVVDFRLKDDVRKEPEKGTVPLLYAGHFQGGSLVWPKNMKKPNAICVTEKTRKWLWDNTGYFVITKRFTSKEERRRIVASVYAGNLPGELIGFENHLNVFHVKQKGFSEALANGLGAYLNSTLVDRYFRQFNGHTQVNATDLRSLTYPDRETLEHIGTQAAGRVLSQKEIDNLLEQELAHMADGTDPLKAQEKIDESLQILGALGMPRGQQNERSALTLLALVDLKPTGSWQQLEQPLMGITPIMEFCEQEYGREYAPNTRETFRRQTMHQFVEAGIAIYNPDKPDRPVNSPKACYQISKEAFQVIRTFGTDKWKATLEGYLQGQQTLADKWARHREMQMIPVQVAEGQEIKLTPGIHSELIKQIITEFAPRFAPGAEVIYVGDTGDKIGYFQEDRLEKLGVSVDQHGKMPDVVFYFQKENWFLLVEAVTSHGPVDAKRHNELAALFSGANPGLVYVTAFPDRPVMARYLNDISWETEVWCADAPSHLIHFDGERFLGPYDGQ